MSGHVHTQDAACATCTYYDIQAAAGPDVGLCRYNPPISQPGPGERGLWPIVAERDWCGQYRAMA